MRYEILPGLPGVGPLPEQFSSTGQGHHSEGFVIKFTSSSGESWVGNFQPAYTQLFKVVDPWGQHILVVAGGQAYEVDPDSRQCVNTFGGSIEYLERVPDMNATIIGNGLWLESWGTNLNWKTRRIAWDGMCDLRIEGERLFGTALAPHEDAAIPFWVDLTSGDVHYGSYPLDLPYQ